MVVFTTSFLFLVTTTQEWKRVLQEYCVTSIEEQRSSIALLDDDDDDNVDNDDYIMKRKQAIQYQLPVDGKGDDHPVRTVSTKSDTESPYGSDDDQDKKYNGSSFSSSSRTSNDDKDDSDRNDDKDEDTTIIITSSLIPTHPSTSTIDKVIDSLHYIQGLNLTKTPIVITIDGLTVQDRLHSPEKVERLYRYANNLHTKYVATTNNNNSNIQIVFQLDRKYLVGNIQHVMMNFVHTTFVYIIQHDIQFVQPINHKSILQTLKESIYYNNNNAHSSSPTTTTRDDVNDVRLVRFPGTSTLIREGIDDVGLCTGNNHKEDEPTYHHNRISNITDTTSASTATTATAAGEGGSGFVGSTRSQGRSSSSSSSSSIQSIRLNGIELTKTHIWSDRNHITTKSYYMEMFSTIKGFQQTTTGGGGDDYDDDNDRYSSSTTTTTTRRTRRRTRSPPRYMERVMQPIAMQNCSYWGTYLYGSVDNYSKMTIHLHGRTSTTSGAITATRTRTRTTKKQRITS